MEKNTKKSDKLGSKEPRETSGKSPSFQVDDIVSVDLSSHCKVYQKRLLGVVVDVIKRHPRKDGVKGELMWGVPWEGPYPLVQVYVPSIVSSEYRGEDGHYYLTGKDIKKGRIVLSDKKLVAPKTKFKVGDRIAFEGCIRGQLRIVAATVQSLPSITNVHIGIRYDGDKKSDDLRYEPESNYLPLDEAKEELARLKAVVKDNEMEIEHRMQIAIDALVGANEALKRDNADLDIFLTANKKLSKKLKKAIIDTVGSVGGEWD